MGAVQTAKVVLDEEALGRTLVRIAHEIVEKNGDLSALALVGIHTRGVPIAHRLRRLIGSIKRGEEVALGTLDITFYRDDLYVRDGDAPLHPQPVVKATRLDFSLEGKTCVLVDDVLHTGRTIRAAIDGVGVEDHLRALNRRSHLHAPFRPRWTGLKGTSGG